MSNILATLAAQARVAGVVGSGAIILNDWEITMEEIDGGHRLTARRGSEEQSMDIMDGAVGSYPGAENVGKLLYVGPDGAVLPLTLGSGLEIVGGVLTVTNKNVAAAICGAAVCGQAICGEE